MRTLIVPCGGNGSRMASYGFPKGLLPLHQRPALFRIIEVWKRHVDEVVLVHNPRNERILRQYFATYYEGGLPVRFVVQPRAAGTYDAVCRGLQATGAERVILNWSDICLHEAPAEADDDKLNWALTTELADHCRWEFREGRFTCREQQPFAGGGVFGVFLLNDPAGAFRDRFEPEPASESEILAAFDGDRFRGLTCEAFTDIGDQRRYRPEDRLATSDGSTRAFGSRATIHFRESTVVKEFSDEAMRANEADWYAAAGFSFLPKVHSSTPLTLERLDAEPCWRRLERDPSERAERNVIRRLFDVARTIHSSRPSISADAAACRRQYLDKTIDRLRRVDFLFRDFQRDGITVNGRTYPNPLDMLAGHAAAIEAIFPERFHFIHGDLQLSNSLIDGAGRLWLIDPRGSFGGLPLYGDALYDFTKLYYSFCGAYDIFSTGRNHFAADGSGGFRIAPLLPPRVFERRRDLFEREFAGSDDLGRGMGEIDLAHAIIWLSAVDYTANDVLSSMYAYLLGTTLLSDALAARSLRRQPNEARLSAAA